MLRDAGPPRRPKLLVSVRDAREAVAALAGGCDILDVKEPRNGPLGMADVATIAEIVTVARNSAVPPPVSAALGELGDWQAVAEFPCLPAGLDYVKTGLSSAGKCETIDKLPAVLTAEDADMQPNGADDWRRSWSDVRRRFLQAARSQPSWIAVAYADWSLVAAPHPADVIETAAAAGCAGLLFDTYTKSGRGLFDWLPESDLSAYVREIRQHGLLLALAGGIRSEQLSHVANLQPDIVAIRTAGCRDGIRSAEICTQAVRRFRAAVEALC